MDFLSNHPLVDENRIGVLGICGGYSVSAAQIDHRIRALATVSMYDMGRARRQGLGDTMSYEQRMERLDEIGKQRTLEARGELRRDIRALPTSPHPPIRRPSYASFLTITTRHVANTTTRLAGTHLQAWRQ